MIFGDILLGVLATTFVVVILGIFLGFAMSLLPMMIEALGEIRDEWNKFRRK